MTWEKDGALSLFRTWLHTFNGGQEFWLTTR